jgi:hypothetical protein
MLDGKVRSLVSGGWVVNLKTAQTVAFLKFELEDSQSQGESS